VRHRLQAELLLDPLDDLDRLLAARTPGAVGDRDERRVERLQLAERGVQVLLAGLGLRRGKNSKEKTGVSEARISLMRIR